MLATEPTDTDSSLHCFWLASENRLHQRDDEYEEGDTNVETEWSIPRVGILG